MHLHKGYWYPDSDTKLQAVHDWVEDIDTILQHVKGFDVCVQAGGAVGVWPARLAARFATVYTFEPVPENFACLMKNVPGNVVASPAALGATAGGVSIRRDEFETGNAGAWYTAPGGDTRQTTIDGLHLAACDLICLDVEGAELQALLGAAKTLGKFRPVIVLEEKQLPHMTQPCTRARDWLQAFGYREAGRIHRDVIFTC